MNIAHVEVGAHHLKGTVELAEAFVEQRTSTENSTVPLHGSLHG